MALQKNMTLNGGAIVSNCYVRIHSVEIEKQDGDSGWSLKLSINVYKDIHEILASLGMNIIVLIGFILDYRKNN